MNNSTDTKKLYNACNLFLERDYDKGNRVLAEVNGLECFKKSINAQISLFSYNFDDCMEYCKEYLPYLGEWNTQNMIKESFAMFSYVAFKTEKKEEAIRYLSDIMKMYSDTNEKLAMRAAPSFERYVSILNGTYDDKSCGIENNMLSLTEALDSLKKTCRKANLNVDTLEGAKFVLSRTKNKIDASEYIRLYEAYSGEVGLTEMTRYDVIDKYLSINQPEKVLQVVRDTYLYSWIPVEKTIVMPVSVLTYNPRIWELLDTKYFEFVFNNESVLLSRNI